MATLAVPGSTNSVFQVGLESGWNQDAHLVDDLPDMPSSAEPNDVRPKDSGAQRSRANDSAGASGDPSTPIDVSILVVSFNTREMTLECLRSVVRETPSTSFELIVIDNCSTDGSLEAIESEFGSDPRFRIVDSEINLGFAGANNALAKVAGGDYLLLLNPDTVVLDAAVEKLVEFAESNPRNRIWGGRTLFEDGTLNPTSCWGGYTLWTQFCRYSGLTWLAPGSGLFNSRAFGNWQRDTVREVEIVTGCFLLIKKNDWELLEGFDPEFFMYAEEADLCMRSKKLGFQPIITPDATIVHHGGASERVAVDKWVRLLNAENRLLRRHWPAWRRPLVLGIEYAGILARSVATLIRHGRGENLWWGLFRRRKEWVTGLFVEPRED